MKYLAHFFFATLCCMLTICAIDWCLARNTPSPGAWPEIQQRADQFAGHDGLALDRFDGCVRGDRGLQCSGEKKQDFPTPILFSFECDTYGCRRTW